MGPHPAVAQIRREVRRSLSGLHPGDLVLAACSGGPDSLALAAALAFEAPRAGLRAGGVTVDHGLQDGSAQRAAAVTGTLAALGLDPVSAVTAAVARRGARAAAVADAAPADVPARPGAPAAGTGPYRGPEGAARDARYAALAAAAAGAGAVAVALGHTLDDQAETVLLGLARGSGARSLAGMAPRSGSYLRPLLAVRRTATLAACAALGLEPWRDPHNTDPSFSRARVRGQLLPALTDVLGPGVAEALARSAGQLRADADLLDQLAAAQSLLLAGPDGSLAAAALGELPAAIRSRILRAAAVTAGCPAGAVSARHVRALDELVTCWHGQGAADLPGGVRCRRRYGRLLFSRRSG